MHEIIQRLIRIENQIKEESDKLNISKFARIIAISKTFSLETITPLIDHGHIHFGENKVQEAKFKWATIKKDRPEINLHFVGKIQTNKIKDIVKLFDFVHSLESFKQAEIFSNKENELNKKLKYFVQINIGDEIQKGGIQAKDISSFLEKCLTNYGLNITGLMCLPPNDKFAEKYFESMKNLKTSLLKSFKNLELDLSMGMSNDYIKAINYGSSYIRIGTKIFGERK
tara:strand:- start:2193 stop:2873 length:681 start_codon:yes stop_codon:yes gene_type:complete